MIGRFRMGEEFPQSEEATGGWSAYESDAWVRADQPLR